MPPKEPRVPKGPLERRNKSRIMVDIGIDLLSQSFSTPTANSPNEANNVTIKANEANKANNFGNQAKHARITPNTSNTVHQTSKQVKKTRLANADAQTQQAFHFLDQTCQHKQALPMKKQPRTQTRHSKTQTMQSHSNKATANRCQHKCPQNDQTIRSQIHDYAVHA